MKVGTVIRRWKTLPAMMASTEGLHAYADRFAALELAKGACATQWILVREDEALLMVTPWEDDVQKRVCLAAMRQIFENDPSIVRFSLLCEVWTYQGVDVEKGTFASRGEGLMIHTQDRSGVMLHRNYDVERTGGRRRRMLNPDDDVASVQGPIAELFGEVPAAAPSTIH